MNKLLISNEITEQKEVLSMSKFMNLSLFSETQAVSSDGSKVRFLYIH